MLPAERITVAAAIEAFQRRFPLGFEDPSYIGDRKIGERAYKVLAHEYLDAEFGNGKLRSRLSGDIGGVIDVVSKAIGMVNLLAVQESLALRDALQDQVRAEQFLLKLAELLESDEPDETHFNAYADSIANLPALRGRVATWPVATFLPFLVQPQRHMLLKPEMTRKIADSLGFEINYRPEINWLTYSSLLRMAAIYRGKLASLKPRDMIDIQSFFWIACGGYD